MKPCCKDCRHFSEYRAIAVGFYHASCEHPDARVFNRIHGYRSATLRGLNLCDDPDGAIADCDREGRFEKKPVKRPWWML